MTTLLNIGRMCAYRKDDVGAQQQPRSSETRLVVVAGTPASLRIHKRSLCLEAPSSGAASRSRLAQPQARAWAWGDPLEALSFAYRIRYHGTRLNHVVQRWGSAISAFKSVRDDPVQWQLWQRAIFFPRTQARSEVQNNIAAIQRPDRRHLPLLA